LPTHDIEEAVFQLPLVCLTNRVVEVTLHKLVHSFVVLEVLLGWRLLYLKDIDQGLKALTDQSLHLMHGILVRDLNLSYLKVDEEAIVAQDLLGSQLVVHYTDLVQELEDVVD